MFINDKRDSYNDHLEFIYKLSKKFNLESEDELLSYEVLNVLYEMPEQLDLFYYNYDQFEKLFINGNINIFNLNKQGKIYLQLCLDKPEVIAKWLIENEKVENQFCKHFMIMPKVLGVLLNKKDYSSETVKYAELVINDFNCIITCLMNNEIIFDYFINYYLLE